MKITGPGTAPSAGVRRKQARASTGGSFSSTLSGPGAGIAGADMAGHIDPMPGLLALQEILDPDEERRRGAAYGQEVLDHLDGLRMGLLSGRVSREGLDRLVATMRARRSRVGDPRLAGILQEIELRAAVELAKLRRGF